MIDGSNFRAAPPPRPGAGRIELLGAGRVDRDRRQRGAPTLSPVALIVAAARAFTEGDGYLTGQVVDRRA
jgi:hypothetical protein